MLLTRTVPVRRIKSATNVQTPLKGNIGSFISYSKQIKIIP